MHNTKITIGLFAAGFLAIVGIASAQMGFGMMGSYSQNGSAAQPSSQSEDVNGILQGIYKGQNITTQTQVDCSKITDDQFEKLGDAYMEIIHPGQAHEYMDQMMGGEGSASLRQAHVTMGRSYLGCWSNYNSRPLYMPMMGGYGLSAQAGMMGGYYGNSGDTGRWSSGMGGWPLMMGSYYTGYGWFGWITMILTWVLLALGIATAVKWLRKK